jgi:hypothetical protein
MLFEARELIDMFGDLVESRMGKPDEWARRVRDEIDAYRAERGWSPHGFGGEDVPVLNVSAPDKEAEALRYAQAVEAWAATRNPKPERMPPGDDPRAGDEIRPLM